MVKRQNWLQKIIRKCSIFNTKAPNYKTKWIFFNIFCWHLQGDFLNWPLCRLHQDKYIRTKKHGKLNYIVKNSLSYTSEFGEGGTNEQVNIFFWKLLFWPFTFNLAKSQGFFVFKWFFQAVCLCQLKNSKVHLVRL